MFHSHETPMLTNIIILLFLNSYHDIIIGHRYKISNKIIT